ncbi:MAG: dephospho-CoA kinase [Flavisolibacter sp.]
MSLKIGLTGGIGSGKSIIAKIFELFNVPVYYADEASKRLYHSNKSLIKEIKFHFGEDIYKNEQLDRQKLASIVFSNPQKLELLNQLVHPLTIRDAEEWMKKQTSPYIIKEAALLFESGSVASLDYVIGVKAPLSIRIKRVIERDGVSKDEILSRMSRQIDEDIKMRLCDFIITNDEHELVIPQALELHMKFMEMGEKLAN